MIPLIEKYRAKRFHEIIGQDIVIWEVKNFYSAFPLKKALILNGNAGTGKTSIAIALANEYDLELFELNASDLRNKSSLEEVLKPALDQSSLFKKKKLILMDEADGITGSDRGGLNELINLIGESKFPILITANDIWKKKFSSLRGKCKIINMKELKEYDVRQILINVLHKENKRIKLETLNLISRKSKGDVRAGLNDLQSVLYLGEKEFVEDISDREKQETIFSLLKKVFQDKADEKTLRIYDSIEMDLDEILLWVEENIPEEYNNEALAKAYDSLSRADVFKGRIYRQQHWRFLVYENFFLSAGIATASRKKNKNFIQYKRPGRILKIWLSNQKNAKNKNIIRKYAGFSHMSKKKANKERFLLPLILDGLDDNTKKKLNLDDDEENYLRDKKGALIVSSGLNRFR